MIGCVRLPAFAADVERRDDPALLDRPLILATPDGSPALVYAVSSEATQAGILAGMTAREARALCPEARTLLAEPAHYRRVLDDLTAALARFSDRVETTNGAELRADARHRKRTSYLPSGQIDAESATLCYLDIGRLSPDDAVAIADQIHDATRTAVGLTPAVGMASGKFPACVAASSLRRGEVALVREGQEAAFLADFPSSLLPGDGEMLRQLHLLGLETLGQVAALPAAALLDRFGRQGWAMHRLAGGHDTSPVRPYTPRRVERITRQFDGPVVDRQALAAGLGVMVEALASRLQTEGLMARELFVTLLLDDGGSPERGHIFRGATASVERIGQTVEELVGGMAITSGVVEAEITLGDLTPAVARQLSLFDREPVAHDRLRAVLCDLVARYGETCFYWISLADRDAHLPERRFQLTPVDIP